MGNKAFHAETLLCFHSIAISPITPNTKEGDEREKNVRKRSGGYTIGVCTILWDFWTCSQNWCSDVLHIFIHVIMTRLFSLYKIWILSLLLPEIFPFSSSMWFCCSFSFLRRLSHSLLIYVAKEHFLCLNWLHGWQASDLRDMFMLACNRPLLVLHNILKSEENCCSVLICFSSLYIVVSRVCICVCTSKLTALMSRQSRYKQYHRSNN